ncbi:MAG TPA: hypothetical protein VMV39_07895 [Terracidiphilus sp.]|nr:hypothetical protein [Terracidiphilus sp.]
MEIGPIPGGSEISRLNVQRRENTQFPVFEIEPSARTGDETYSASHQAPERGLEEEDAGTAEDNETGQETPSSPTQDGTRISFFA